MNRNPEKAGEIKVLGNLYSECVYVAVNSKGSVNDEGDLQSSDAQSRGAKTRLRLGRDLVLYARAGT